MSNFSVKFAGDRVEHHQLYRHENCQIILIIPFVSTRMGFAHHSLVRRDRDSNWTSILGDTFSGNIRNRRLWQSLYGGRRCDLLNRSHHFITGSC